VDRATTKKPIDLLANAVKDYVRDHDMMPGSRLCTIRNLFSERILRTASCRRRFLKHAHHYYDVIAAKYVWNHPEAMEYVSLHSVEEGKDIFNYEMLCKIINKMERGVMEYVRYRFPFEGRVFTVKTELTFRYYEQFYAIYEERD